MRYTFASTSGNLVTVEAKDEREARSAAMMKLHGSPLVIAGFYVDSPRGLGLMLRSPVELLEAL